MFIQLRNASSFPPGQEQHKRRNWREASDDPPPAYTHTHMATAGPLSTGIKCSTYAGAYTNRCASDNTPGGSTSDEATLQLTKRRECII